MSRRGRKEKQQDIFRRDINSSVVDEAIYKKKKTDREKGTHEGVWTNEEKEGGEVIEADRSQDGVVDEL